MAKQPKTKTNFYGRITFSRCTVLEYISSIIIYNTKYQQYIDNAFLYLMIVLPYFDHHQHNIEAFAKYIPQIHVQSITYAWKQAKNK